MDFFIKKIFDGVSDDLVHLQFQKYSRGTFKDKSVVIAKNSKGLYSISTTSEYASEFVRAVAEELGDAPVKVTGAVISTRDLSGELKFVNKKQFMGIKQYIIEDEMTKSQILGLCDKFPKAFLALSFTGPKTELKVKAKAPTSGKPSTKAEDTPKADFCKLKTSNMTIVRNLLFDVGDFKYVEIKHDYVINDMVMPTGETDPLKIREMAKRKGVLVRQLKIDDKITKKEKSFVA